MNKKTKVMARQPELDEAIIRAGFSYREFSDAVVISVQQLSDIRKGICGTMPSRAKAWAEILEVDFDDIWTLTDGLS